MVRPAKNDGAPRIFEINFLENDSTYEKIVLYVFHRFLYQFYVNDRFVSLAIEISK